MIDYEKVGRQIAFLRKEKGLTGEKLSEILNVSPQAVSKWENGKCLPETVLLPGLAKVLGCSVDALLSPRELLVLEAVYTDGQTSVDVTQTINNLIYNNRLDICATDQFASASIVSDRLKILTVKYQTPNGTFFDFAVQNKTLAIDISSNRAVNDESFKILGAYYGNAKEYNSAMQKMEHYKYFKWKEIHVNHETFPSYTASDDVEYLTLVYLNKAGIHTISCPENDSLSYGENHTELYVKDTTKHILPGIIHLSWEQGEINSAGSAQSSMDCPWCGALYAALKYMGEGYTYEQLMGLSGACYRVCFVDVWDWSCTDALVAFDYSTVLFNAIGYEQIWANRIEKGERKAERQAIIGDIQNNKPVLAMNLRIAPEWGVITGYLDNGNEFLCRTYFDKEVFDDWAKEGCDLPELKKLTFSERGGYLVNDYWPYMIVHFGKRVEKPSLVESLFASLKALVDSFYAPANGGYTQGKAAYEAWIQGLSDEAVFNAPEDKDSISRRLGVNDNMLLCLIDARRCAESYLRESAVLINGEKRAVLNKIADNYAVIYKSLSDFRTRVKYNYEAEIVYNTMKTNGVSTTELRREQIDLLAMVLELETDNAAMAMQILEP